MTMTGTKVISGRLSAIALLLCLTPLILMSQNKRSEVTAMRTFGKLLIWVLVFIGLLIIATRLVEEIQSPEHLNGKLPGQGFPVVVQYVDNGQISLADWRVAKEEQSRRPFSLVNVQGENRIDLSDTAWFKYSISPDAAGNKVVDLTSKNSDSTKRSKYRVTDHDVFPMEIAVDSPGDVMIAFPIAALALLVIVFLKKKIMGEKVIKVIKGVRVIIF